MRIRRATPPRPPARRSSRSRARGTGGRRRSTPRRRARSGRAAVATARDHAGSRCNTLLARKAPAAGGAGPRTPGMTRRSTCSVSSSPSGEPRARRRLGRGRLGHPRPAARRRRASVLQELIVRGQRGVSRSCLPALGGLAHVPHWEGSRRARMSSTSSSTGPGPRGGSGSPTARSSRRLARAPLGGGQDDPASQRSAHVPAARDSGVAGWWRGAARAALRHPEAAGARSTGRSTAARGRRSGTACWTWSPSSRAGPAGAQRRHARSSTRKRGTQPASSSSRPTGCSTACSSTSIQGTPPAAEAAASPVADHVRGVYRLLDAELGTLVERTDDDDLVVLMSDHGHQPCTRALSMNKVLSTSFPAPDAARPS